MINRPDIIRPPLRFIKVSHRDILPVEGTDDDPREREAERNSRNEETLSNNEYDDRFEAVSFFIF